MLVTGKSGSTRILVVRLGAMGDIIHALPAVASIKHSSPGSHLTWVVEPRWAPLLAGNPFVDSVVELNRRSRESIGSCWRRLRASTFDFAIDFQGLIKSALVASAARPERIFGFHYTQVRERTAALFYSDKTLSGAVHVVERNLDLARSAGARSILNTFPLPVGSAEGDLPETDFVLASPLAGWRAKQWPMEYYEALGDRLRAELGMPLVVNLPPGSNAPGAYSSSLAGLIHATRCAIAVVGVDSGPMHLAAALGKPGVAIFGPTDPARNGPYGDSISVLRDAAASTTYKRSDEIDDSMRRITPDHVFEQLRAVLRARRPQAGCTAG
jgi:heptosyltransferase-1